MSDEKKKRNDWRYSRITQLKNALTKAVNIGANRTLTEDEVKDFCQTLAYNPQLEAVAELAKKFENF